MIEEVLTGALLGLLMASVFVSGGALIMTPYLKAESRLVKFVATRGRPTLMVLSIVGVIYVLWSVIGAIYGLLFIIIDNRNSQNGLGSPNLIFTLLILILPISVTVLVLYTKRVIFFRVLPIILIFGGIFGWMMPYILR